MSFVPTFRVEDLFELQKHISKLAHIAHQLHDVVWVRDGRIWTVRAVRTAFDEPGGTARTQAGAG